MKQYKLSIGLTFAPVPDHQQDTSRSADAERCRCLSAATPRPLQQSMMVRAKGNKELTLRAEQEVSTGSPTISDERKETKAANVHDDRGLIQRAMHVSLRVITLFIRSF